MLLKIFRSGLFLLLFFALLTGCSKDNSTNPSDENWELIFEDDFENIEIGQYPSQNGW
ncbi:MAG: hypothetical protein GF353_18965, partial [Candidatus Lokiarchaeota archaeon]|nr:hypothetical protein [Candidatus Lokiarchaeota archaeon]